MILSSLALYAALQSKGSVLIITDSNLQRSDSKAIFEKAIGSPQVDLIYSTKGVSSVNWAATGGRQTSYKSVIIAPGLAEASSPDWRNAPHRFVKNLLLAVSFAKSVAPDAQIGMAVPPRINEFDDESNKALVEMVQPLIRQAARESHTVLIDAEGFAGGPVALGQACAVIADAAAESMGDAKARKKDWKIAFVDSQEISEGPAKDAIDGNPDTYWHTDYSTNEPKPPHWIDVDLGIGQFISGVTYLPRQGGSNGRAAEAEVYTSLDGKDWGTAAATAKFGSDQKLKRMRFEPRKARFIRFKVLKEINGKPWSSVAELDVIPFRG